MAPADAFRSALDLFDTGVALMPQTLRRTYPNAPESEMAQRLRDWLWQRPGAEGGTIGHLIALKVLARDDVERAQDMVDLRALVRQASAVERARAWDAVALIHARGYHRGRDLEAALREFF